MTVNPNYRIPNFSRTVIVGPICAGKTTLAHILSDTLKIHHIELDALYWRDGWKQATPTDFRYCVDLATRGHSWIADGNYAQVRSMLLSRATLLVWLNFPFRIVLSRALIRSFFRAWRKTPLFSENYESFRRTLFSKDSILFPLCRDYNRLKIEYKEIYQNSSTASYNIVELCSQKDISRLIEKADKTVHMTSKQ